VSEREALWRSRAGRAAIVAIAICTAAALVGALLLRGGETHRPSTGLGLGPGVPAEITAAAHVACGPASAGAACLRLDLRLRGGPDAGRPTALALLDDGTVPRLSPGDRVRVLRTGDGPLPAPPEPGARLPINPRAQPYALLDVDRRRPLLIMAALFCVLVIVLGRGRGAASLVGLAGSLVVSLFVVVPALLDGRAPVPVALCAATLIGVGTILVTHGLSAKSVAAALGTLAALAVTTLLALAGVRFADLTGLGADEAVQLARATRGALSLDGLLVAGVVISALGVLDDITTAQAATVLALRRANPTLPVRTLYREAADVGRDHVAATVNTLALAYVGTSLPVLLVFGDQGVSIGTASSREAVAEALVAALCASAGVLAAMPLTTALAALLAVRLPAAALPAADAHHH
jgi:uncharacterized membrane protein